MKWKLPFLLYVLGFTLTAQIVINDGPSSPVKRTPVTEDDLHLAMMANMIKVDTPLTTALVQLHRMGDDAAVTLLKLLGSRASPTKFTDSQKRTVLEIIRRAFEHPNSITNRSNVTPNATNVLLNMLNDDTEDSDIKAEISRIRLFAADAASHRVYQ
jgi:hypothetical protein